MRLTIPHAALLTAGLLLATVARAADPPAKESTFGGGKASGPVLTREQLRGCFAQQDQVAQRDAELPKDKAALATTQESLVRSGETLKARLDAMDRTDEKAVAAYNDEVQARDRQVEEHQARVAAFNTRVEAAKSERDAFAKACGNRSFYETDAAAIKRGK